MKRLGQYGLFSCGVLIPIASLACLFSAAVGGTSFGVAPQFNLNMVERFICPEGSQLAYQEGPLESYDAPPSPSNPTGGEEFGRSFWVECVGNGQVTASGNGLLIRTIASILGAYFLACAVPLFLVFSGGFLLIQRTLRSPEDA
jgi:hypothetical protein